MGILSDLANEAEYNRKMTEAYNGKDKSAASGYYKRLDKMEEAHLKKVKENEKNT